MIYYKYKIMRCYHCGNAQVSKARLAWTCKRCGSVCKVNECVLLYKHWNAKVIRETCKNMNALKKTKREKICVSEVDYES